MLADFSKGELSLQLDGLINRDDVYGILDGKDYQCIDMVLHFICAYVVTSAEYIEDAKATKVNMMYSGLLLEPYSRSSEMNTYFKAGMFLLKRTVRELKDIMVRLLEDYCEFELVTIKFLLFDHLL